MIKKHEISLKLISNIDNSKLVNDQILLITKTEEIEKSKETITHDNAINGTELFSFFTANVIQCDEIFVR